MHEILLVIISGGLGSALRYSISLASIRLFGSSFAWGTMAVNLLGCFAIGFAVGLVDRSLLSRTLRIIIITGFLGGFTTFSTFSLESIRMILGGALGKGLANIGINVAGGIILSAVGLYASARV